VPTPVTIEIICPTTRRDETATEPCLKRENVAVRVLCLWEIAITVRRAGMAFSPPGPDIAGPSPRSNCWAARRVVAEDAHRWGLGDTMPVY